MRLDAASGCEAGLHLVVLDVNQVCHLDARQVGACFLPQLLGLHLDGGREARAAAAGPGSHAVRRRHPKCARLLPWRPAPALTRARHCAGCAGRAAARHAAPITWHSGCAHRTVSACCPLVHTRAGGDYIVAGCHDATVHIYHFKQKRNGGIELEVSCGVRVGRGVLHTGPAICAGGGVEMGGDGGELGGGGW